MCVDISFDLRSCVSCVVGRVRKTSARFVDEEWSKSTIEIFSGARRSTPDKKNSHPCMCSPPGQTVWQVRLVSAVSGFGEPRRASGEVIPIFHRSCRLGSPVHLLIQDQFYHPKADVLFNAAPSLGVTRTQRGTCRLYHATRPKPSISR